MIFGNRFVAERCENVALTVAEPPPRFVLHSIGGPNVKLVTVRRQVESYQTSASITRGGAFQNQCIS